jgi:pimeloyl-ACP methyl ester carboxylesterase
VVQRGVDVDRDSHLGAIDTVAATVATAREQIAAVVRNGVFRPGPDPSYADGDDASWIDVDWRALQSTRELLGQRVNVLDTGAPAGGAARVPLLFLHGWSSNWQIFLLNIPAFMRERRCIALDLPGFGASELPRHTLSIQGYTRLVDAVCDSLGVPAVAVVGNSMGGFIGAELALSFATRVERLVLVSSAGLSTERVRRRPALVMARAVAAGAPRAQRLESAVVHRARLRRAAMQWVFRYPERLSVPLAQELVLSFGKPGFVPALEALLEYSHRERLAQIEIPVLIVWGRNDLLVPVGDAYRFERLIGANARVEVFEDTGHAPMLERPTRFNDLLRGFLAGGPPTAGAKGTDEAVTQP